MLLCLVSRHPLMLTSLILLVVKELFADVSGLVVIKQTGDVPGAEWHGKLTTLMIYGMMILHVLWQDIPLWMSNILNIGCIVMMLLSFILYARRNIRAAAAQKRMQLDFLQGGRICSRSFLIVLKFV